ncbi:MAG: response regulator [Deltaproteobacteria bacterium]|nr:response regulator [Deltaproteobacteria bacterium]
MPHILVVDDEPEIVKMVARIMEARGHRVTTARDGQEALDVVARDRPDVVVLDLNIPKLDGFEVCRRLKGDDKTKSIPVVMLTAAYPTVDDATRGIGLGADEYVVKPFLREVLVHNVERLLAPGARL